MYNIVVVRVDTVEWIKSRKHYIVIRDGILKSLRVLRVFNAAGEGVDHSNEKLIFLFDYIVRVPI